MDIRHVPCKVTDAYSTHLSLGTCLGGSGPRGTHDGRSIATTDGRLMKAGLSQQKDLLMMQEAHWMYVKNEIWMWKDERKART